MPSQFHNVSDDRFLGLLGLAVENGRAGDLQALLAPRGYDLAALTAAGAERDAFAEALRRLRDLRGEARTASDAFAEARVALRERPEWLERLGIRHRGRR